jgi:tetratricopeptide (TPR) repeat protein
MRHGPTVLVLEDLHWADATSLRLTGELASLTSEGPLLVVLTRRPEPDPGTSALEAALVAKAGLRLCKLVLSPLAEAQEQELARALLGPDAPDEIVRAVSDGTAGNPLFLEERLSSLMETNALRKAETGAWRLDLGAPGQVPEALERLVRSRVDRLARGPRDAMVAASVLGPEFTLGALAQVADVEDGMAAALDELCSAGLLVQLRELPEPTYRFRHSLIQEATYKGLVRQQRRHLHSRAAWGLEGSSNGRLGEVAGLLGHHYAMAGDAERGARFLELAGDRAATAFANDEAVACYRRAVALLGTGQNDRATAVVEVWLKLGALFWRLGRYDESREALREAAALVPAGAPLLAARSLRWLGQLEIEDCHDDEARLALDAAEKALQECPDKETDKWAEIWVDVELSRSNLHYWRDEHDLQLGVLDALRPVVEQRANTWQKADFYAHVAGQRWRAQRFVVDDGIIAEVRAARTLVAESGLDQDNFHWQTLGFLLLLKGELVQARAELEGALATARRAGDRSLELVCLIFLAWARLRQHDVAGVKELALQSRDLVSTHAFPASAMTIAMLSWVAWKEARPDEAECLAEEAIEQWRPTMVRYPFAWICLWPLMAVRLTAATKTLLSPPASWSPRRRCASRPSWRR